MIIVIMRLSLHYHNRDNEHYHIISLHYHIRDFLLLHSPSMKAVTMGT